MWSLDLRTLGEDHNSRNEVSYRPQPIRPIAAYNDIVENVQSILDFWLACEPTEQTRFQVLDTYLLREALWRCYKKVKPFGRRQRKTHKNFVEHSVGTLVSSPVGQLAEFLMSDDPHPLFERAKEKNDPEAPEPLPIIARAILLLRVASAAVERNLLAARVTREDLKFWWEALGFDFGYWTKGDDINQMTDLWADIGGSIAPLEDWCDTSPDKSKLDLNRRQPHELIQISQFNRAGLWAIGI